MHKYIIIIFLLAQLSLYSQDLLPELPMGFREIVIGITLDQAKEIIPADGNFNYRGDPDVSMLLVENTSIIETKGYNYILNGYFQFYNEILYSITLILDTKKIDYYTIFTQFINKYGKYDSLNPDVVIWENDNVRISLEKPLTLKYVGKDIYQEIIDGDVTEKAIQDQLKEDFINEF